MLQLFWGSMLSSSWFHLNITHPVVDGSFDSGKFEQFPWEKVEVDGKTGNLGNVHLNT
jgi:large subunit ribosomal protein L22e